MSEERGLLRAISWHECFPWLILFRAALMGFYLRVMFLAYVGVCVLSIGQWIGDSVFVNKGTPPLPVAEVEAATLAEKTATDVNLKMTPAVQRIAEFLATPLKPLGAFMFEGRLTFLGGIKRLFFVIWYAATLAFFGGAISRIAAMEFAVNDRCGLKGGVNHACRKFMGYFLAPLFPLIGATVLLGVLMLIGLINWFATWLAIVTGIFGFIGVLISFVIGMLLVPLIVGWPLMWGAISTESSDHFDALSRSYAYITQRPFHYLWYLIIAILAGSVGVFAVTLLAFVMKTSLETGLIWGQGWVRTEAIQAHSIAGPLWSFWFGMIERLVPAYAFGYFFAVFSGIYLLLRRDVDQAEIDEIILDDTQPRFAMPALNKDLGGEEATNPES
ncbi:hypothetical protein [Blastopirellula marina]|uniref:Uncharacterized protein n=1 Tax=Blastopirellula marina TaxID=124 RepID=A0A2S8GCN3_9BACT|nr:hypothetical protein [Blastopirellula marina]PQO42189.1 hypothetical protein C5Y93_27985 [Blastopirellula marina]